jgi:hypothetical protein
MTVNNKNRSAEEVRDCGKMHPIAAGSALAGGLWSNLMGRSIMDVTNTLLHRMISTLGDKPHNMPEKTVQHVDSHEAYPPCT